MQNKIEKPKHKHNKKRNTAFLFESLVKELTKSVVYGQRDKQKIISSLIKQHYSKKSVLNKELELYKQLYETKEFPKEIAEKLINKIKEEHAQLNETDIYNEQSKLIAKINKHVGMQVYNNFVPNYKTIATISQIFNKNVEAKQKILLEQELAQNITSKILLENKEAPVLKNYGMTRFIERFNEAYSGSLLSEQKVLLSKYINHSDEDLELKLFISEELTRLKQSLSLLAEKDTTGNAKKIEESIKSLKIDQINEELIKKLMFIQQFVHEVNN